MINAGIYAGANKKYRLESFNIPLGEEGGPLDRPLIVQVSMWNQSATVDVDRGVYH